MDLTDQKDREAATRRLEHFRGLLHQYRAAARGDKVDEQHVQQLRVELLQGSPGVRAILNATSGLRTAHGIIGRLHGKNLDPIANMFADWGMFQHVVDAIDVSLGHLATPDELLQLAPPAPIDALERVTRICRRFPAITRPLRQRRKNHAPYVVDDEYDVQDLMHALLRVDFDDIRPEEWAPSYAGGSSRMDFLLKAEQLVVETKMTRDTLTAADIGEQLLADIARYEAHADCKTLVCFVYDPQHRIGNPAGLERDLTRLYGKVSVVCVIAPT